MYGTIDEASAYHEARGNQAWATAPDKQKSEALTRASDYISAMYGRLERVAPEATFRTATYIASGLELGQPGFFSITSHPDSTRKVLVGVDSIRWQVVAGPQGEDAWMPRSSLIDALFARWQGGGGLAAFVV